MRPVRTCRPHRGGTSLDLGGVFLHRGPFALVRELARTNGWQTVTDPYGSGKDVYVIPAIRPDVAVIHANEVDERGNARVYGSPFWDHPLTRAARRVLITAERLVPTDVLRLQPELTLVPGFMVEAVAIVPQGEWPGSMHPLYEIDYPAVEHYMRDAAGVLEAHLAAAPENQKTENHFTGLAG